MDLPKLRAYLDDLIQSLSSEDRSLLGARLRGLISVFPFNEYEYILTFLVDRQIIRFQEYEKLRNEYISANPYLGLFELAPRIFGDLWCRQHLMDLDSRFQHPKKSLDPDYQPGQYDLWCEGHRIEIKAARAIDTKKRGALVSKALRRSSPRPFWMNFQQIKPDMSDVFIFIGVWVDEIAYWVMSAEEVRTNKYLSHQHRGGIEYQIGITPDNIYEFDLYKVPRQDLVRTVQMKGKKT